MTDCAYYPSAPHFSTLIDNISPVVKLVKISWAPGPYAKRARGGLVSIDKKAIEIKRMGTSSGLHHTCPPHSAVVSEANCPSSSVDGSTRSARGGGSGRGSTQAQRSDACDLEPTREEATTSSPDADMCVGRLEVADTEAWEWVSVRATRGFAALQGKHSVEMEVTPVGTRRRRVGSTKSSGSEDRNTLRCMHDTGRVALCWIWCCDHVQQP